MRHNSEITLYEVAEVTDKYGSKKVTYSNPVVYEATVSIGSNELSPKPSGLGYYRILTVMLPKNVLKVKDVVEHNDVRYNIATRVLYEHSFLEAFIGYEV